MISSSFKKYHYKFQYYADEIKYLKEYINNMKSYESPQSKPVYDITNAFTPAFIDFFCRKFGISHYASGVLSSIVAARVLSDSDSPKKNHRAGCQTQRS
jgi:hypothetical protein